MAGFRLCLFCFGLGDWEGGGLMVAERMRAVLRWATGQGGSPAEIEAGVELARRRTLALPSILTPYGGLGRG